MKKLRIITLMTVLALISADSFAGPNWFQKWRADKQQRVVVYHDTGQTDNGIISAPLDGGLLVLLGAAGIAYYGVRRKKNRAE